MTVDRFAEAAANAWHGLRAAAAGDAQTAARHGLLPDPLDGWRAVDGLPAAAADLVALYQPFIRPLNDHETLALAHLGQSLDGCVATANGDSCDVTGHSNIVHLHRLRALADAVIVGAGTVCADDPRLTTRLVPGSNPVRVVLDPTRRLHSSYRVFTDGAAPTLLCTLSADSGARPDGALGSPCSLTPPSAAHGQAEVLVVPSTDGRLDLRALTTRWARRGLRRLFIEGGGLTVSEFLAQGVLSRLQIAVAPLIIGCGRPGITHAPQPRLSDCMRPPSRLFQMGGDVLYDFDLGGGRPTDPRPQSLDVLPRRLL